MDTPISTDEIVPDNSTQSSTTHIQTPTNGSPNPPTMAIPNSKRPSFRLLRNTLLFIRKSKPAQTIDTSAGRISNDADEIPQLHCSTIFENSPPFEDFKDRYDELTPELKLCLLCFSVFPENAIIKKRLMVYWWIGEGFLNPETEEKTEEDHANEFFHRLIELGFIEPIPKKRGHTIDRCKMHPFVRSSVIILAKRAKFFDFNEKGEATEDFSTSFRCCLSGKGSIKISDLDKLHMLFNLNKEFHESKKEWFSKMRNINVLCLGEWKESATHHILAEEKDFLNGLDSMKHLKLFSLQRVSQITEIPKSISSLSTLKILDLRACHNLEVIDGGIGFLKSLTHLDMSECYLLDQMPKELSSLSNLQVLKGFVVADSTTNKHSCTINDLAKLTKLKKLSIHTGLIEFPLESELQGLQKFPKLLKLTIDWGRGSSQSEDRTSFEQEKDGAQSQGETRTSSEQAQDGENSATLPAQLEKLDLQCFPKPMAPEWLKPANLKSLKRLYIRGGKLRDLGHFPELSENGKSVLVKKEGWGVERLRLKYLDEMEMDWRGLQELFPKLVYLEKVKCPKLTFFPCDESGVWIERAMEGK